MMMKSKSKRNVRAGGGAVLLIAGLLVGSAGIRLGIGAGQAVATENNLFSETAEKSSETTDDTGTMTASKPSKEELSSVLAAFQQREKRLAEREKQLEMRLKALAVADEQIEKRLQNLKEAEASLKETLALSNVAAEDDLSRLTSVYENMKPKDAAALFEEMEPAFAAGFLGRMRPNSAAGIMAGLSPQAAYSISVILAGRNADVPKG